MKSGKGEINTHMCLPSKDIIPKVSLVEIHSGAYFYKLI